MNTEQFNAIVRKRFRATALGQDIGQSNLARITGYSREHVSRWSRGHRPIPKTIVMILTLMEAMDLNHEQVSEMLKLSKQRKEIP
jgi:transcriptional regulator with XRE-family HTH domain